MTKLLDDNIIIRKGESMEIIKQIYSETLIIKELKNFLGRKVKINIEVIDELNQKEQKAKPLGKYKLGKKLDDVNIRDFAHEA